MLGDLFRFAGYTISEQKLNQITSECPEQGLRFEQFKGICSKLEIKELSRDEMQACLKTLATEESDYIEVNSLMSVLSSSQHPLSEEEMEEVVSLFKPNSDGKVSIDYILSILFK
jgi:Ca2+-binding EF-hand superfamily protein